MVDELASENTNNSDNQKHKKARYLKSGLNKNICIAIHLKKDSDNYQALQKFL